MSLDALQKDWNDIEESSTSNKISNEQIRTILHSKYRSWMIKTFLFEAVILFLYLYFIALIIFQFNNLNESHLKALAVVSIISLLSLLSLKTLKLVGIYRDRHLNYSHTAVFQKLAQRKIREQQFQIIHILLGALLMVILLILSIKMYNEYDLVQDKNFWFIIIPGSIFCMTLMNRWIRKHHSKAIEAANDLLKELE